VRLLSAKHDIIASIIFFALSVVIFVNTFNFPEVPNNRVAGPAFFPQLVAVLLAIISIVLIVESIPKLKLEQKGSGKANLKSVIKVVLSIVATVLYASLMKTLGFTLSTFLYFAALMAVVQVKVNPIKMVLGSAIMTGVVYSVFILLLKAALPRGIFF
jgi:putative tricarboxylic transport membrane protein